jgi:PleD family two-component response regulator
MHTQLSTLFPLFDDAGELFGIGLIATDITERTRAEAVLQQSNRRLQQQSIRDPLTGLYNRRYLDETLPHELQRAARARRRVST